LSGPAVIYAAQELLSLILNGRDVIVRVDDMFSKRLMTPWGLVRFGVVPDHLATKRVITALFFGADDARPHGSGCGLNVEWSDRDISHPHQLIRAL